MMNLNEIVVNVEHHHCCDCEHSSDIDWQRYVGCPYFGPQDVICETFCESFEERKRAKVDEIDYDFGLNYVLNAERLRRVGVLK